ncbi:zinc transporter ZIP11 isoform X3 [Mus musculus]|uniref:Zinc transporter ZIP11 n=6 Tax=Mus musculus TaxID=10090 RepID=S39AB_MOUSE|nr:zinc transporter ZIP11 isoform 1 [Mus musculus]NP_001349868.1 zinc transporter ZIP11 isoform 1 [Mus musculus]NP_001349869.1 zinc transporter ZIP11 isoform 1 [Mus musculus]XP_006534193.1 zinc transporter ZIP11 isoform X3 [Mus musculus]XP_011247533.1 zinc transporter ZIP11 isoform X3 [Mus musculus]XP_030102140.1 zinc transporter ZIP11 isoform X3 [Mus musculus]XP_030102141.1 zinc transporter ZIP11 isoform X3 [Mus musculus]XP_030102142.1 zinc transporter ZIP11 isoform X3 [Mus musculus]XP_036|eukprot:NP_001159975.1 zinc transporter ZIP11 isoform 1 [Mus musculus]
MLQGYSSVVQALLGTFFTWAMTAAGAALVFIFSSGQRRILDGSLGFAAGVMLAASYWSLLAPAVEMATSSGGFGAFAFFPVAVGFTLGAAFVYLADLLMPHLGATEDPQTALALNLDPALMKKSDPRDPTSLLFPESELSIRIGSTGLLSDKRENGEVYQRKKVAATDLAEGVAPSGSMHGSSGQPGGSSWRRIALLILAITIHNIPEGLAVGVGFGAVEKTASATFESARNLAIGIGIQNFPEGLAVSLPLRGAGFSTWKAFWYGQLSGMVEPLAGVFGAFAVVLAEPILPYALAFAAGAMVYVVMDDIIPEAQISGNGKLASWASILGFVVMMSLDVGLG